MPSFLKNMAVIGKIRSRMGGLLVVLVGGALLLFVVGDFLDNRQGLSNKRAVGTIGGEEVDLASFERRVSSEVDALRNDFGQPMDGNAQEQVRNSVWNEIVRQRVLKTQAEEAGFGSTLSKEEYDDIRFGNNIVADFKNQPNFQNPATGQVDPEKVRQWFVNVETASPTYYAIQKERMVENRLYEKYNKLVRESIFANTAQAKDEFEQKNLKATFDFAIKAFNTEADSLHAATDAELQTYYNAHKNERKYRQKASRDFDHVGFQVTATEEDKAAIRKELEDLRPEFETAKNDSVFCVGNGESRSYAVTPYTSGSTDVLTDSLITHADTGTVIGPYQNNDRYVLSKVKEFADVPEARVRHILLNSNETNDAEVKERADSILAVVKKDRSKFESLVTKFSDDGGSKANGGVYEWFDKNRMVPEFTKASFDEKTGAITVCKTSYGYHIVEVLGQRTRKERRICSVDRTIAPSPKTYQSVYKKANAFSLDNNTAEKFKSGADTMGLDVKNVEDLRLDQRSVPGLQETNTLVSWVNNAKVGDVSGPIQCGSVYVVATLRGITEEGVPALDDVREIFTREVVKEKKAQAFRAQMEGKTDLNALATEMGLQVQTATDMTFSANSIPGGYPENELIGRIFALKAGETAGPFTGDNGVYMVRMNTVTPAPELTDATSEKQAWADRRKGSAEGQLLNALREAAGVVDERGKYY